MSLDYGTRKKIREFIRLNMAEPLTAHQIAIQFRLRPDYEPEVQNLLDIVTEVAVHGRDSDRSEIVTRPVVLLDLLIGWLVGAGPQIQWLLTDCRFCRNHLLYLLDTAPYTDQSGARIGNRLAALPEAHKAHGVAGPDQHEPDIRWITP